MKCHLVSLMSCSILLSALIQGNAVYAHDSWISRHQFRDPETNDWCCDEKDCFAIGEDQVIERPRGFSVRIDYFGASHVFDIPGSRVLPSSDAEYWVCLSTEAKSRGRGISLKVRCFFAPLQS